MRLMILVVKHTSITSSHLAICTIYIYIFFFIYTFVNLMKTVRKGKVSSSVSTFIHTSSGLTFCTFAFG